MRLRAKKDANHQEIIAALQQLGVSVIDTANIGTGFPDAVLGFRGHTVLIEIKNPKTHYGRKGFSDRQRRWNAEWRGSQPIIVRSVDEAIAAVMEATKLPGLGRLRA